MARQLQRLWKEDELAARNLLREFCLLCRRSATMPESLVSRVLFLQNELQFHIAGRQERSTATDANQLVSAQWDKQTRNRSGDYLTTRKGGHLLCPFECVLCIFRKLCGHHPDLRQPTDEYLLACIRRMNLDAFWSRAISTVTQNARRAERMIDQSTIGGIMFGPFITSGAFPAYDHCVYQAAFLMLDSSLDSGKYATSHQQFDTIRQLRTTYSNFVRATLSSGVNGGALVLGDYDGKHYSRLEEDECGLLWFERFIEWCKQCMGQDWQPDQAITPDLLSKALTKLELKN
ncbi:hypothetical protein ACA910_001207 [Epithemia clementina (nom. ined.)]